MSKKIVAKTEINNDPKLALVKAFRITNKRAGEEKRKGHEGLKNFLVYCAHLRELSKRAEEMGFKIWVNLDGKTGHTYSKDYRKTPDEWNDFERHNVQVTDLFERQVQPTAFRVISNARHN